MIDRRELILAHAYQMLRDIEIDSVPVGDSAFRNRPVVPPELRPALVLMDGSEDVTLGRESSRGGRPPSIVTMYPQVWILLRVKSIDEHELVGPELSKYRLAVLSSFLIDADLKTLLGTNGGVTYRGFASDMEAGQPMEGQIRMKFDLRTLLKPEELT